jgi:hypothetical protein
MFNNQTSSLKTLTLVNYKNHKQIFLIYLKPIKIVISKIFKRYKMSKKMDSSEPKVGNLMELLQQLVIEEGLLKTALLIFFEM